MLKAHSALLKKSKASTPTSRALLDRIREFQTQGKLTSEKAASYRDLLSQKNYSPLYIQRIHRELDQQGSTPHSHGSGAQSLLSPANSTATNTTTSSQSKASSVSYQWNSILYTKSNPPLKRHDRHISWDDLPSNGSKESSALDVKPSASSTSKSTISSAKSTLSKVTSSSSYTKSTATRSSVPRSDSLISRQRGSSPPPRKVGKLVKLANSYSFSKGSSTSSSVTSSSSKLSYNSSLASSAVTEPLVIDVDLMNNPNDSTPTPRSLKKEQLFTEMCVYARLGFLQPPCCLSCAYRESINGASPIPNCTRWTVWRKNANQLLHPVLLEDNLLLVQCRAARQLMQGEVVDGRKWDATQRTLVMSHNSRQ